MIGKKGKNPKTNQQNIVNGKTTPLRSYPVMASYSAMVNSNSNIIMSCVSTKRFEV
jgi:hypothetical protein